MTDTCEVARGHFVILVTEGLRSMLVLHTGIAIQKHRREALDCISKPRFGTRGQI